MRDRFEVEGETAHEKYTLVVWESVMCTQQENPELAVMLIVKGHRGGSSQGVHIAAKDAEVFALEILATLKDIGYEFGGES